MGYSFSTNKSLKLPLFKCTDFGFPPIFQNEENFSAHYFFESFWQLSIYGCSMQYLKPCLSFNCYFGFWVSKSNTIYFFLGSSFVSAIWPFRYLANSFRLAKTAKTKTYELFRGHTQTTY